MRDHIFTNVINACIYTIKLTTIVTLLSGTHPLFYSLHGVTDFSNIIYSNETNKYFIEEREVVWRDVHTFPYYFIPSHFTLLSWPEGAGWIIYYILECLWIFMSTLMVIVYEPSPTFPILILNIFSHLFQLGIVYFYYRTWPMFLMIFSISFSLTKYIQLILSYRTILYYKYKKLMGTVKSISQNTFAIGAWFGYIEALTYIEAIVHYNKYIEYTMEQRITLFNSCIFVHFIIYYTIDIGTLHQLSKYCVSPYFFVSGWLLYELLKPNNIWHNKNSIYFYIHAGMVALSALFLLKKLFIILAGPTVWAKKKETKIEIANRKKKTGRRTRNNKKLVNNNIEEIV